MKKIFAFAVVLALFVGSQSNSYSQVKMGNFFMGPTYTEATSFNDDSVEHAENYGYNVGFKLKPHRFIRVGITFNYTPMRTTELAAANNVSMASGWYVPATRGGAENWWADWNIVRNYQNSYAAYKNEKNQPLYIMSWTYEKRYNNYEGMINMDFLIIPEGMVQPYINVGIGAVSYYTTTWDESRWEMNLNSKKYYFEQRNFSYLKHRGFLWPVQIGGGVDLMLTRYVGINASVHYFSVVKNHKRFWMDAWYRIASGVVFHF